MEINELKTYVNNSSAYPVMQNKTKEINTSNIDNIEEQIVSNNTDTFTFSKSSDELTVTGRNANGSYTIIDPWDGTTRDLTEMEHYTNENDIAGYAIISTTY